MHAFHQNQFTCLAKIPAIVPRIVNCLMVISGGAPFLDCAEK